jgi:hypothetical protein
VESVLDELAELLYNKARELYPQFATRLAEVKQMASGIGWGFGDYVSDVVERRGWDALKFLSYYPILIIIFSRDQRAILLPI